MRNLRKDKRGIVWVWLVFIIAVPTLIIAYMPIASVSYQVMDICLATYAYPEPARTAIDILGFSIAWCPIILLLGFIAWALKSSINPQEVSYPYAQ